ncbi:MAG: hypothetical protein RIF46_03300 [Cyclobacteriaceae bacterium]
MMNRLNIKRFVIYLIFFVIIQIPMLQNWVFYGTAFPFQYIGFILLLPHDWNRNSAMLIGFFLGLLMDVFSNTPGMHAMATVFLAYARPFWLEVMTDTADEDLDLSISHLGYGRFLVMILPVVFVHHFILFALENEGFGLIWNLLGKVFWSSILSTVIIFMVGMLTMTKKRRE